MNHNEELLAEIRKTLLRMSNLTIAALQRSIQALNERSEPLADEVICGDPVIDHLEMEVDDKVVRYMATHAPMARDSRLMLTASKISSNLERIADQATTIARHAKALNQEPPLSGLSHIQPMAKLAVSMLRDALSAFMDGSCETAHEVILRDQEVDRLNRLAISEQMERMMQDPGAIRRGIFLMTISKAIERSADHAQNIAEEVHYLYQGKDIRHQKQNGVKEERFE